MSDREIIEEVRKYPAPMIVLTGGEPSLFIDDEFISDLKEYTGKYVAIETNGTFPLPEEIDWVTLSPKFGMGKDIIENEAPIVVEFANEVKVVDVGQDLDQYFKLECVDRTTEMLLQPCFVADPEERERNTRRTVQRVLRDPRWRLSLQTHRYLGIL